MACVVRLVELILPVVLYAVRGDIHAVRVSRFGAAAMFVMALAVSRHTLTESAFPRASRKLTTHGQSNKGVFALLSLLARYRTLASARSLLHAKPLLVPI